MNKTKIPWCDYAINPVKGLCPMACTYCYARRMYKRFKWNPEIRFDLTIEVPKNPSRIFVGSTMELFGDWVQPAWMKFIFNACLDFPEHTYIFLTKKPENLIKWSPFPDNCWVGVSATDASMFTRAWEGLKGIQASVKFVSIEPLLKWDMNAEDTEFTLRTAGINWVIIGQQTPSSKATSPKIEWIEEIAHTCTLAGIPLFMKDNLLPLYESHFDNVELRQEYPLVGVTK